MIYAAGKRLVVVELPPEAEKKKSILIFPGEKPQMRAKVLAIGSEVDKNIQIGDTLYLPSDTGIPLEVDGERVLSIVENQILASTRGIDV